MKIRNYKDLANYLIACMDLGIRIESKDGHRWIQSEKVEYYDFYAELKKHDIALNNKIYGGYIEALEVIEKAFNLMGRTLDNYLIDKDELFYKSNSKYNRIDTNTKGGLF